VHDSDCVLGSKFSLSISCSGLIAGTMTALLRKRGDSRCIPVRFCAHRDLDAVKLCAKISHNKWSFSFLLQTLDQGYLSTYLAIIFYSHHNADRPPASAISLAFGVKPIWAVP